MAAIVLALALKTVLKSKPSQKIETKEHLVAKRDVCRAVYGSGYLVCSVRAGVVTEIEGKLIEIKADEGDIVEAESIVAVIDNENIENDVNIARGEVDKRREELEKLRKKPDRTEMLKAEINHSDAKENFENFQRNLADKEEDFKKGHGTEREIEELKEAVEQAEKKLEIAKENLAEVSKPATEVQIAACESLLKQAEIKLKNLEHKQKSQQVKSPIKGTVLKRSIDPETADLSPDRIYPEGTDLFIVGDLTTMMVKGSIFESDVQKVRQGQQVKVVLNPTTNYQVLGKLDRVSLTPGSASGGGKFDVDIKFDTPPKNTNEGLRVDFRIIVQEVKDVVAVPVEFVKKEKGRHFVMLQKGGKRQQRQVETGISDDNFYQIKSGLRPGDKIVWSIEK